MKNILIGTLIILAFIGGYFFAKNYNFTIENKTAVLSPTPSGIQSFTPTPETQPTPTGTATKTDEEMIKASLVKKHGWNPDDIVVTVSKNDGQFARGSVKEKSSEVGGGMFLAKKTGGQWEIVFDGNGIPDCTELKTTYLFPQDLLVGICD